MEDDSGGFYDEAPHPRLHPDGLNATLLEFAARIFNLHNIHRESNYYFNKEQFGSLVRHYNNTLYHTFLQEHEGNAIWSSVSIVLFVAVVALLFATSAMIAAAGHENHRVLATDPKVLGHDISSSEDEDEEIDVDQAKALPNLDDITDNLDEPRESLFGLTPKDARYIRQENPEAWTALKRFMETLRQRFSKRVPKSHVVVCSIARQVEILIEAVKHQISDAETSCRTCTEYSKNPPELAQKLAKLQEIVESNGTALNYSVMPQLTHLHQSLERGNVDQNEGYEKTEKAMIALTERVEALNQPNNYAKVTAELVALRDQLLNLDESLQRIKVLEKEKNDAERELGRQKRTFSNDKKMFDYETGNLKEEKRKLQQTLETQERDYHEQKLQLEEKLKSQERDCHQKQRQLKQQIKEKEEQHQNEMRKLEGEKSVQEKSLEHEKHQMGQKRKAMEEDFKEKEGKFTMEVTGLTQEKERLEKLPNECKVQGQEYQDTKDKMEGKISELEKEPLEKPPEAYKALEVNYWNMRAQLEQVNAKYEKEKSELEQRVSDYKAKESDFEDQNAKLQREREDVEKLLEEKLKGTETHSQEETLQLEEKNAELEAKMEELENELKIFDGVVKDSGPMARSWQQKIMDKNSQLSKLQMEMGKKTFELRKLKRERDGGGGGENSGRAAAVAAPGEVVKGHPTRPAPRARKEEEQRLLHQRKKTRQQSAAARRAAPRRGGGAGSSGSGASSKKDDDGGYLHPLQRENRGLRRALAHRNRHIDVMEEGEAEVWDKLLELEDATRGLQEEDEHCRETLMREIEEMDEDIDEIEERADRLDRAKEEREGLEDWEKADTGEKDRGKREGSWESVETEEAEYSNETRGAGSGSNTERGGDGGNGGDGDGGDGDGDGGQGDGGGPDEAFGGTEDPEDTEDSVNTVRQVPKDRAGGSGGGEHGDDTEDESGNERGRATE
ncbi:hypothetical protein MKZ38_008497 [Zalerion maritima]|uniref:Uncharacterized protein n=1 Tax=Zalerion maritima TaxID=339359 RepID=A0AAD5RGY7_9PEZI|nr:hypothetical protein MKZ38_008497 [Zalerion maritima]